MVVAPGKGLVGVNTTVELLGLFVNTSVPGTITLPIPGTLVNTSNESLPLPVTTVDGFSGLLMFHEIVVFTATPAAPSVGTTDVTDGLVVSGVLEAPVLKVLLNGVTGLPLGSLNPLTCS